MYKKMQTSWRASREHFEACLNMESLEGFSTLSTRTFVGSCNDRSLHAGLLSTRHGAGPKKGSGNGWSADALKMREGYIDDTGHPGELLVLS